MTKSDFLKTHHSTMKDYRIAVAGTGYVGLSIATLLSQHHHVTAVDVIPEKVEMLSRRQSPIQDEYIERYLAEKPLDLTATLDGRRAYADADFVVIATTTPSGTTSTPVTWRRSSSWCWRSTRTQ